MGLAPPKPIAERDRRSAGRRAKRHSLGAVIANRQRRPVRDRLRGADLHADPGACGRVDIGGHDCPCRRRCWDAGRGTRRNSTRSRSGGRAALTRCFRWRSSAIASSPGAAVAIMLLFFALTGGVFLLTQIYQFVLGHSPSLPACGLCRRPRCSPSPARSARESPGGSGHACRLGGRDWPTACCHQIRGEQAAGT